MKTLGDAVRLFVVSILVIVALEYFGLTAMALVAASAAAAGVGKKS